LNWTELEELLGDYCGSDMLSGSNSTLQIPMNYTRYIDLLELPLSESYNVTLEDPNMWDNSQLKMWVKNYVDYHNAVANYSQDILPIVADDSLLGSVGEGELLLGTVAPTPLY